MLNTGSHWDELMPLPDPATPDDVLAHFAKRWPLWTFSHDATTGTWRADRDEQFTITHADPKALWQALAATEIARGEQH